MDNEAQTPAVARLERAIESLEAAVAKRVQAAIDAPSGANAESDDLARRHESLKSAVAATLGEIDKLLEGGDNEDA